MLHLFKRKIEDTFISLRLVEDGVHDKKVPNRVGFCFKTTSELRDAKMCGKDKEWLIRSDH